MILVSLQVSIHDSNNLLTYWRRSFYWSWEILNTFITGDCGVPDNWVSDCQIELFYSVELPLQIALALLLTKMVTSSTHSDLFLMSTMPGLKKILNDENWTLLREVKLFFFRVWANFSVTLLCWEQRASWVILLDIIFMSIDSLVLIACQLVNRNHDTFTWSGQCWPTSKNISTTALRRDWM